MATVDIGGTDYEVMAAIANHDSYLAADITRSTAWDAQDADTKDKSAVAVYRFFQTLNWIGEADTVSVPWPRTIDGTSTAAPLEVLFAAYVLAADVAAKPATLETFAKSRARGPITKVEAGSAKVTYEAPSASQLLNAGAQTRPVPDSVWAYLKPWLRTSSETTNAAGVFTGTEADVPSEREYGLIK